MGKFNRGSGKCNVPGGFIKIDWFGTRRRIKLNVEGGGNPPINEQGAEVCHGAKGNDEKPRYCWKGKGARVGGGGRGLREIRRNGKQWGRDKKCGKK